VERNPRKGRAQVIRKNLIKRSRGMVRGFLKGVSHKEIKMMMLKVVQKR